MRNLEPFAGHSESEQKCRWIEPSKDIGVHFGYARGHTKHVPVRARAYNRQMLFPSDSQMLWTIASVRLLLNLALRKTQTARPIRSGHITHNPTYEDESGQIRMR
jgi:hypothetical protein